MNDKKSPLHGWNLSQGARMVPFAGYEMPLHYQEGILKEHLYTREKASLFDVSHMGVVKIYKDPDYIEILERIFPIDLQEMDIGDMRYTTLLDEEGYILDDLLLSRFSDYVLLVVNAASKEKDYQYLKRFFNCSLLEDVAIVALQGPEARGIASSFHPLLETLTFMKTAIFQQGNNSFIASCSGYTGEDGFEFIIPAPYSTPFVEALMRHSSIRPAGLGARDSLRLEAGLCLYGQDIDHHYTPVTACLEWTIGKRRKEKGNFCGDTVILQQLKEKKHPKRVLLKAEKGSIARGGEAIFNQVGKKIGQITSGVHSPTLNCPIAMAYIERDHENDVEVEIRDKKIRYQVLSSSPVSPKYYKG